MKAQVAAIDEELSASKLQATSLQADVTSQTQAKSALETQIEAKEKESADLHLKVRETIPNIIQ